MKKLFLMALFLSLVQSVQAQQMGGWSYVQREDPLTDADTSFIALPPLGDLRGTRAGLSIKCDADAFKGFNIIIPIDGYLGSEDEVGVLVRFDKAVAKPAMWFNSVAGTGVFVSDIEKDDLFAKMKKAKMMVFRVQKYDKGVATYQFNLSGLSKALIKLKCAK